MTPELTGRPIDALPSSGIRPRPARWGSRWGSENARVGSNLIAMTVNRKAASPRAGVRISEMAPTLPLRRFVTRVTPVWPCGFPCAYGDPAGPSGWWCSTACPRRAARLRAPRHIRPAASERWWTPFSLPRAVATSTLLAVLDPDVVLRVDGAAAPQGVPREISGAAAVANARSRSRSAPGSRGRHSSMERWEWWFPRVHGSSAWAS
jgi:hypothetical protein